MTQPVRVPALLTGLLSCSTQFLYINSSFSPAPDDTVGVLHKVS